MLVKWCYGAMLVKWCCGAYFVVLWCCVSEACEVPSLFSAEVLSAMGEVVLWC